MNSRCGGNKIKKFQSGQYSIFRNAGSLYHNLRHKDILTRFWEKKRVLANSTRARLKFWSGFQRRTLIQFRHYEAIVTSCQDGIIGKDLSGMIVSWNKGAEQIYGYTEAEMIGRNISNLVPTHLHDELATIMRRLHQGEFIENFDTQRITKDEGIVNVSLTISPLRDRKKNIIGASTVARDITQSRAAQLVVEQNEESIRLAIDSARMGAFTHYLDDNSITASPRMRELFYIKDDGGEGGEDFSIYKSRIHPKDIEVLIEAVRKVVESKGEYRKEYRVISPEGNERWVRVYAMFAIEPVTNRPTMVGVVDDITADIQHADELKAHASELTLLYEAGNMLGSSLNSDEIYDTLNYLIRRAMPCDHLIASRYDSSSNLIECIYAYIDGEVIKPSTLPPLHLASSGLGMQSTVIHTGEPLILDDLLSEAIKRQSEYVFIDAHGEKSRDPVDNGLQARSALIVPIIYNEIVVGTVQVMSIHLKSFGDSELRILQGMVRQAALALQNAELYQNQSDDQSRLSEALYRERSTAQMLQRSLLLTPHEELITGVDIAHIYEPAISDFLVGGDFFDSFPISSTKSAYAVGDASGKGLEAAVRTAEVKYALRIYMQEHHSPGVVLSYLNKLLCRNSSNGEEFVTLSIMVIDSVENTVTFASAGTEPLVVIGSGDYRFVEARGLPLGIDAAEDYQDITSSLFIGDTALMFTDGFTEARPVGGEVFGIDAIVKVALSASADMNVQGMSEMIVSAAKEYAQGKLPDDACLLLARRSNSNLEREQYTGSNR